jgi:hypothetical protein
MFDQDSADYFRRRERTERAAAKSALSEVARRIHQELAESYAERLHDLGADRRPPAYHS